MQNTHDIVRLVGIKQMTAVLDVTPNAVRKYRLLGKFPPGWFDVVEKMCVAHDLECPRALFDFKSPAIPITPEGAD